ncbi:hypothetical protein SteCoe_20714 [Stentor coeruleus]|uniref:Uncharacterized protein n=1 Tax=Stentor coeruleus TaxID=5963 RepID=A0A1R2BR76_9CILI|nr:hypothetical protein SteCoe_20714 [Stentor coeruleus]
MEHQRTKMISPIPKTKSQKSRINVFVNKIMDFHYKKPQNLKSTRMVLDSNIDEEIESIQKFILISHKKKQQNTSELTTQDRLLNRNTPSLINPRNQKASHRKKLSLGNLNTFIETEKETKKKREKLRESSHPILSKHKILFDLLDKKSKPVKLFLSNSQTMSNIKSNKMLKLDVERNLHKEYIKDRVNFKLGNGQYICNKEIWRPDYLKILRKADKVLSSLPKFRV